MKNSKFTLKEHYEISGYISIINHYLNKIHDIIGMRKNIIVTLFYKITNNFFKRFINLLEDDYINSVTYYEHKQYGNLYSNLDERYELIKRNKNYGTKF